METLCSLFIPIIEQPVFIISHLRLSLAENITTCCLRLYCNFDLFYSLYKFVCLLCTPEVKQILLSESVKAFSHPPCKESWLPLNKEMRFNYYFSPIKRQG